MLVWEYVVWPLILDLDRSYFTLQEYHRKRDQFCQTFGTRPTQLTGGFISLVVRGVLIRKRGYYSIHHRLIAYMRKRETLELGYALKEVYTKR